MENLVEKVDEIISEGFEQRSLMLNSSDIAGVVETHDELPSIIVPIPITSEIENLGDDYYSNLKNHSQLMLVLQLEYDRLKRTEDSPIQEKITKYRNVIRKVLSKYEINEKNIYNAQISNLSNLRDDLGVMLSYSRHLLERFRNYENKVQVEIHLNKGYLTELSSKISSIELVEKELKEKLNGKNPRDADYMPFYMRYKEINRRLGRERHALNLAQNSISYLEKELLLLEKLGHTSETSTDNAENIFYNISYYKRSLSETEELVFTEIEKGKNIRIVGEQVNNLTKTVFDIYQKIGITSNTIRMIKTDSYGVFDNVKQLSEHKNG